jgi:hypothetical protein
MPTGTPAPAPNRLEGDNGGKEATPKLDLVGFKSQLQTLRAAVPKKFPEDPVAIEMFEKFLKYFEALANPEASTEAKNKAYMAVRNTLSGIALNRPGEDKQDPAQKILSVFRNLAKQADPSINLDLLTKTIENPLKAHVEDRKLLGAQASTNGDVKGTISI